MAGLLVFSLVQIVQHRSGSGYSQPLVFQAKAFQVGGAELLQQGFIGIVLAIHPVVQGKSGVVFAQPLVHRLFLPFGKNNLGRIKTLHQFLHVFRGAFGRHKLTGRQVEESNAGRLFGKTYRSKKIIGFGIQHIVAESQPRSYQLGNSPFDNAFDALGVFQLVADGHPVAGPYQFGQVGIKGVVRKTRQLHFGCRAVGTLGKHNIQHFTGGNGIFSESLIKITYSEQQQSSRVSGLDGVVLLHQRSFFGCFGLAHKSSEVWPVNLAKFRNFCAANIILTALNLCVS